MDSAQSLAERIAQATPNDVILGMFFESSLDRFSLLKNPEDAQAVRASLGMKKTTGFFRYPVSDLLKLLDTICKRLPNDYGATIEDMGRAAVRSFFESPIGKTMLFIGGDSPFRLLSSAPAGYKACASFGERSYEKTGERSAVMSFRGELLGPAWPAGNISEAIQTVCKLTPKIEIVDANSAKTSFQARISW
jgi:uncharacterized protein (TIGR02265 family)